MNLVRNKSNSKKVLCPRCHKPLWLVPTEFGFYIPHCVICGFEDYSRTTWQSGLSIEDLYKTVVTQTDTDAPEVA